MSPLTNSIVLFNSITCISLINYARHISFLNTYDKFLFTNDIVNKGNFLTIATNKKGEVSFCSESIYEILGYTPEEVQGLEFWKLTEDQEFKEEAYHDDYIDNRSHTRKLKCKNGTYKFIQWKDKKFSDALTIGIGQDITEQVLTKNQYQNLIETATDLIYEIDIYGKLTFINNFSIDILLYTKEELYQKHFSEIIREDYREMVLDFYKNPSNEIINYPSLIFPLTNKRNETIWVSQRVSINRNDTGEIIGFSTIARDITDLKNIEIEPPC